MKSLTKQARKEKGLTLMELQSLTGIGKTTLNNIENNKVYPTTLELEKIARALNVRINDLFESDYK